MKNMNPQVKEQWAAALESGTYAQTQDMLCNGEGGFCCLGVLTDLFAKTEDVPEWDSSVYGHDGEEVPCDRITEWAGLEDRDPWLEIDGTGNFASSHNDSGKVTFAQLAQAIREQL